jgi:K+-sensing histidine kinase KdpD
VAPVSKEKMARAFEVVERNALAQLDLVEDLLDLSRVITGKFRLDVQPVNLTATINAAVEAIQPAATAKGITVKVDAGPDESLISGDEARLAAGHLESAVECHQVHASRRARHRDVAPPRIAVRDRSVRHR